MYYLKVHLQILVITMVYLVKWRKSSAQSIVIFVHFTLEYMYPAFLPTPQYSFCICKVNHLMWCYVITGMFCINLTKQFISKTQNKIHQKHYIVLFIQIKSLLLC